MGTTLIVAEALDMGTTLIVAAGTEQWSLPRALIPFESTEAATWAAARDAMEGIGVTRVACGDGIRR